jgi:hypothetical protein
VHAIAGDVLCVRYPTASPADDERNHEPRTVLRLHEQRSGAMAAMRKARRRCAAVCAQPIEKMCIGETNKKATT